MSPSDAASDERDGDERDRCTGHDQQHRDHDLSERPALVPHRHSDVIDHRLSLKQFLLDKQLFFQ
jgi:hypothetical protein